MNLDSTDCRAFESLEFIHHAPFKRMLAAQAIERRFEIISKDTN